MNFYMDNLKQIKKDLVLFVDMIKEEGWETAQDLEASIDECQDENGFYLVLKASASKVKLSEKLTHPLHSNYNFKDQVFGRLNNLIFDKDKFNQIEFEQPNNDFHYPSSINV